MIQERYTVARFKFLFHVFSPCRTVRFIGEKPGNDASELLPELRCIVFMSHTDEFAHGIRIHHIGIIPAVVPGVGLRKFHIKTQK